MQLLVSQAGSTLLERKKFKRKRDSNDCIYFGRILSLFFTNWYQLDLNLIAGRLVLIGEK